MPNRAPVVANAIEDQTVAVDATETVALGSVFGDPDGDTLTLSASTSSAGTATVSLSGTTLSIEGVAAGTATVTVTATDPGGLQISDTFDVTVTAPPPVNRAPAVASAISDQTLAVNATETVALASVFSDPDGDALTLSASTSSPGTATVSLSGTTLSLTGVAAGTATVTVTATDPGGLRISDTFDVTVTAPPPVNRAPAVASAISDQTLAVNATETVALASVFSDPDGDTLTLSASTSSAGTATVSLSGTTLSIEGVAAGTATVTVTASDPDGLEISTSFVVTVPNRAPVVANAIEDQTVAVDATETVALGSVFGDPDGDTLTLSASTSSAGTATVSLSGTTLSIEGVAAGTATVTVTASDPDGLEISTSFVVTVPNRAPVVANAIEDQTVAVDATETVALGSVFGDPDGDTLTLSASTSSAGTATVSLSGTTLSIEGVAAGTATVTVTASDPDGLEISTSFVVTVPNRAPVVANAIEDQTVAVDATETVALGSVFGDPDGDTLTLSASTSSAGTATVSLSGTTLSLTGVAAGTATVTVTASDPDGLEISTSFVVTVPNRAPVVANAIEDQTVAVDATATVALGSVFGDPDGDTLTLSASTSSAGTATVSLSGTTLSIEGVAAGTATVTVTASDPDGLEISTSFVVTVPNRAPVVANAIEDQTVAVDATATVALGSVFGDPDGDTLTLSASTSSAGTATVSLSGTTLSIEGVAAGTATVTVTASDPDGLEISTSFVVTVPNRAPVVANAIEDQTVAVDATATVALGSVFSDPDGDTLTLSASTSSAGTATVSLSGTTLSIEGVAAGTATVTVTASDPGGLEISTSFVVTVPNRAPVVANAIEDQTVAVDATETVALGSVFGDPDGDTLTLSASTSSAGTATVSLSGTTLSLTGVAAGTATVTVTASDPDGLEISTSFVVTVPNRAPVVANAIEDQTVAVDATETVALGSVFSDPDADTLTLSASTSSAGTATVSLSGTTLSLTGVAAGTATVTVTASDPDGLEISTSFVVTVTDPAPSFGDAAIADLSLTQGVAMAAVVLPSASGGNGALRYSLSPALPAGVTFDPDTRTLSGAPSEAQDATTFTYTVADADANTGPEDEDRLMFNIAVLEPPFVSPRGGLPVLDAPWPRR